MNKGESLEHKRQHWTKNQNWAWTSADVTWSTMFRWCGVDCSPVNSHWKGESLPSLDRLSYIAKRLGKNMADLLDHDNITIPDEYYEMKNRLIKFPTYRNPERIKAKLALNWGKSMRKFFELLPEEELLTLDILEKYFEFY